MCTKPRYMIVVRDSEQAECVRDFLRGEIGRGRLRSVCGVAAKLPRDCYLVADIVIADPRYPQLVGAVRNRAR